MSTDPKHLFLELSKDLSQAQSLDDCAKIKVKYFGKAGSVSNLLKSLGSLSPEEKKSQGQKIHAVRQEMEQALQSRMDHYETLEEQKKLNEEKLDLTLPGRPRPLGTLHPLTQVEQRIRDVFISLGFETVEGPEIETDYYNFEALNFPHDHPARDMQDTLFVEGGHVLRTHTSPMQVRFMEQHAPHVRIIVPGRVYRHDQDTTHSPVFHQIEGLCVGQGIHFSHLKGTLEAFVKGIFGPDIQTRFRPSFFPFTEPSAEMDIWSGKKWMEILGCGMVDPQVFLNVGKAWEKRGEKNPYDPEKISGFAFGLGIERIAMLLYKIEDIRLFYDNDQRFLNQFIR